MAFNQSINVCVMNIRAQTGLNYAKQRQIEDFLMSNKIDILHLQESHVEDDTFNDCNYISANYDIIANNSLNKFGTASLVKSDLEIKNVSMDQEGRVIVFDVGEHFTCGNFYLPCGTDRIAKGKRENIAQRSYQIYLSTTEEWVSVGEILIALPTNQMQQEMLRSKCRPLFSLSYPPSAGLTVSASFIPLQNYSQDITQWKSMVMELLELTGSTIGATFLYKVLLITLLPSQTIWPI